MKKTQFITYLTFFSCIFSLFISCLFKKDNRTDELFNVENEKTYSSENDGESNAFEIKTTKNLDRISARGAKIGDFILSNSRIIAIIGGNSRIEERGNILALQKNGNSANILKKHNFYIRDKIIYPAEYNKIKVLSRGGAGIPSQIIATGTINDHKDTIVTTTYTLNESQPLIRISTILTNRGQSLPLSISIGDVVFWNSENIFIPSLDATESAKSEVSCAWTSAHLSDFSAGIFPMFGQALCTLGTNWVRLIYRTDENLDNSPLTIERNLIVGEGDTVTLTRTDNFYKNIKKNGISGSIVEEGNSAPITNAKIFYHKSKDRPLGFAKSSAKGNFYIDSEEKPFFIQAKAEGRNPTNFISIPLELTKLELTMGRRGKAIFQIFDGKDKLIPARITFKNQSKEAEDVVIYTEEGKGELYLSPGKYSVIVTHGLEFGRDVNEILIEGGSVTQFTSRIDRLIHGRGYYSLDFTQHGENSIDSVISQKERIISNVAEGLDIFVSSDHDTVTDYSTLISDMKFAEIIKSIKGIEISSNNFGNFTIFPAEENKNNFKIEYDRDKEEIMESLKKSSSIKVIQINQSRLRDTEQLEGNATLENERNTFNTVQIFNGEALRIAEFDEKKVLSDWFTLLNMGATITATGSGESHTLKSDLCPTYPRNVLHIGALNLNEITDDLVVDSVVNKKNLSITTGHFLEFIINDQPIGGSVNISKNDEARVNIKVSAVPWIDLETVTLYKNGDRLETFTVKKNSNILRFEKELKVKVDKDSWFVLTSRGKSGICDLVPFAVTNPIWVKVIQ